ncbi:MAG: TVP38/TMEM64 family protein [Bacilli bacterium]|nr:TVP38/TMEM64 family protein [Bacilli bacterium]
MNIINSFIEFSTSFISSGGIIFGFLLILVESFIPILPLGIFVALNTNAFGPVLGITISWLATCLGCFLSYLLFYSLSNKFLYSLFTDKFRKRIKRAVKRIKKISLPGLVLIIALPFTPAFLINIICGIATISRKKFIAAILIGKIFMIIFWGYVGKSIIESITDIKTMLIIGLMLLVSYVISKIVSKKMDIE